MSQSGIIAGALLAAFIFWLAVNNRLQTYTGVLWGPTAAPKPSGGPSGPGPTIPGVAPGAGAVKPSGTAALMDHSNIIDTTATDVGGVAGFLEEGANIIGDVAAFL